MTEESDTTQPASTPVVVEPAQPPADPPPPMKAESDGWTMSQERTFIEDLVYKRLTAFLSIFVAAIAGWIAVRESPLIQFALLSAALLICYPMDQATQRANQKLTIILDEVLFKDMGHPAGWVNYIAKKDMKKGGSKRNYVARVPQVALALLVLGTIYSGVVAGIDAVRHW